MWGSRGSPGLTSGGGGIPSQAALAQLGIVAARFGVNSSDPGRQPCGAEKGRAEGRVIEVDYFYGYGAAVGCPNCCADLDQLEVGMHLMIVATTSTPASN